MVKKKRFKKVREWEDGIIVKSNLFFDALLCWILVAPLFIIVALTFPFWYPILQSKVYYEEDLE